jgi:site-specific DNA recombinase
MCGCLWPYGNRQEALYRRRIAMAEVRRIILEPKAAVSCSKGEKLKVAAYCRVSTDTEEQKTSFDRQVESYTSMIEMNPEWELAGIYADEGVTGTIAEKRPDFMRMMADCDAGKINLILTKSISRFARNLIECLTYVRHLGSIGVHIIFEKENIDTRQKYSEILLTILAAFAQEESRSISENTMWGIRKRFEEGEARWSKLYGYEKNADGEYQIVSEQAAVVKTIFTMYEHGKSISEIMEHLKTEGIRSPGDTPHWTRSAVSNLLMNERYIGDLLVQKYVTESHISHKRIKNDCTEIPSFYIENHHAGIIPRKQFERVQLIRSMRRIRPVEDDTDMGQCNQYPLGQKLRCPHCGSILYQRAVAVQTEHSTGWCCERGDHPCGNFIIRSSAVEAALLKAYETVDLEAVKQKRKENEYREDAQLLLSMKKAKPVFDSVDYWWVDDLIDRIEFGKHSVNGRALMRLKAMGKGTEDDRVMKVFWRCGIVTIISSGAVTERDDPAMLAKMHHRMVERRQKKEADAV